MEWYWLASITILVVGVIVFLFLANKYRKKARGIKRYEKIADKLTVREPEPESEPEESHVIGFGWIPNIIGGFVVILVGTSLIPTISDSFNLAQAESNVTGVSDTMVGLTVLFFTLAIVASAFAIAFAGIRRAGLV